MTQQSTTDYMWIYHIFIEAINRIINILNSFHKNVLRLLVYESFQTMTHSHFKEFRRKVHFYKYPSMALVQRKM